MAAVKRHVFVETKWVVGLASPAHHKVPSAVELQSYIYSGVTTILDVGNNPDYIFKLGDMERSGKTVSTRLLAAGGIVTHPGSHGTVPYATLVDSWPQAIPNHGVRTTAHISSETRAREAVFAGIDTLAHPVIQGPLSDDFVRWMKAKQIPEASTLTVGESYSRLAEHPEYLDQPLYKATVETEEISPLDAIRIGTLNSAIFFGRQRDLGSIE